MIIGSEKPRIYTDAGGDDAPSVTTILTQLNKGDALSQWKINCALDYLAKKADARDLDRHFTGAKWAWQTVSKRATDIGTTLHDSIEDYLRDGKPFPDPTCVEEENCFTAAMTFLIEHDIEPLDIEFEVNGLGYGGRADLICKMDGTLWLLDWKTSKAVWDEYRIQLAAYRHEAPIQVERHGVVRFDKYEPVYEIADFTDTYDVDLELFCLLVRFWNLSRSENINAYLDKFGGGVSVRPV